MATKHPNFAPTAFTGGERITVEGFSRGEATFVEYGPADYSCPDNHVSWPGMRIAYVDMDRYGRIPVWENSIALLVQS